MKTVKVNDYIRSVTQEAFYIPELDLKVPAGSEFSVRVNNLSWLVTVQHNGTKVTNVQEEAIKNAFQPLPSELK